MGSPYGYGSGVFGPAPSFDQALPTDPSLLGGALPVIQAALAQPAPQPQAPTAPSATPAIDPTDSTVQKAASTGAPQTPAQQVAHQATSWDNQSGNLDPVARMQALNGADAAGAVNFIKAGHGTLDPRNDNWCAAFTNSALGQSGITGTNSNIASDFMNWGTPVTDPSQVQRNDVMVGKYSYRDGSLVHPGALGSHAGVATGQTRQTDNGLELQMVSGNTEHGHVATTWEPASNFMVRRAGQPVQGTPTGNAPTGGFETPLDSSAPYADLINTAAKKYNMDPKLVQAVIAGESSGNPGAVSGPGATGLMQIMPENYQHLGITDPTNPYQNIMGGTQALSEAIQHQGGNVQNGLKEYFAGPDQSKWGAKTANYPGYILSHYNGAVPSAYAQQGGKPVSNIASMFPNQSSGTNQPTDETQTPGVSGLRNLGLANSMGGQSPLLAQLLGGKGLSSLLNGDGPFSGGNTSRTLAAMSSGFFSGKTPMQSLAGGFGALAKGMQSDQSERMELVKSLLQQQTQNQNAMNLAQFNHNLNAPEKMSADIATMTRTGTGLGDATNIVRGNNQMPPLSQADTDRLNKQTQAAKPLTAAGQKVEDGLVQQAANATRVANQTGTYAQQLHNNEFDLSPLSQGGYKIANLAGASGPEGNKYTAFQSGLNSLALDTAASQKGPGSDAQREMALKAVQGNGLSNNAQGEQHMMKIGASAELQRRQTLNLINNNRNLENKAPMTPQEYADNTGNSNSVFANMSDKDLQSYAAYGTPAPADNSGSAPAAPAQGSSAPAANASTTLQTPGGATVQYTPPSQ